MGSLAAFSGRWMHASLGAILLVLEDRNIMALLPNCFGVFVCFDEVGPPSLVQFVTLCSPGADFEIIGRHSLYHLRQNNGIHNQKCRKLLHIPSYLGLGVSSAL
jgi:hypothetical protein